MALLEDYSREQEGKEEDVKALGRSWYEIPARTVNAKYGFNFKLVDPATDGIIFLVFILLGPFIAAISAYTLFKNAPATTLTLAISIVSLICAIVGFAVTFIRLRELIFKEGLGFIYLFITVPMVMVIMASLIMASLKVSEENTQIYNSFFSMGSQVIGEIGIITFFFMKQNNAFAVMKSTFKENWKMLLLVVVIAFGVMFLLSQIIFGLAYNKLFHVPDTSDNQAQLLSLLNNKNTAIRVSYAILLFTSSVLIAPLCEEICTRHSFFLNSGNKWVALATCSIFFGFIHCGQMGDFIHLPSYIAAGFVLSSLFIVSRGNYNYTWLTHMLSNLTSFAIIMATLK